MTVSGEEWEMGSESHASFQSAAELPDNEPECPWCGSDRVTKERIKKHPEAHKPGLLYTCRDCAWCQFCPDLATSDCEQETK